LIDLSETDVRRLNWFGAKPLIAALLAARPINPVVQLAARTMLPRRIAQRLPVARKFVEYRPAAGEPVRLLEPLRDLVARDIYWGRGQPTSPAERRKLRCIEQLSTNAATFLDIGAYGGLYALIAARCNPQLRAIAYEIVPENYFLMTRNIVENDLVERVEARLCGIGDNNSKIRVPAKMRAASLMSSISLGSQFKEGVEVPVTTLDVETQALPPPFVMKVDVEGYERQVFAGGVNFIEKHRPDIVCEILPGAGEACAYIEAMVRPLGYRTFTFEDDGLREHSTIAPRKQLRDWLISPREAPTFASNP